MNNIYDKKDLSNLISPKCVEFYLMLKFKAIKRPDYFSGTKSSFNSDFVVEFNKENHTNFSFNEFEAVMTALVNDGIFKKFYKFECDICKTITAIKDKGDSFVFGMVFSTGCSCRGCLESSTLSNSKENIRNVTYYCMSSEVISEDIFNLAKVSAAENEELEKEPQVDNGEREWLISRLVKYIKTLSPQTILLIIILVVWILTFL